MLVTGLEGAWWKRYIKTMPENSQPVWLCKPKGKELHSKLAMAELML